MALLHRILRAEDWDLAARFLGDLKRKPDLVIAPDGGDAYLYRWHLTPRQREANVYFHIQVQSDPERPLHDHPWDNQSVILAGGYDELISRDPAAGSIAVIERRSVGQTLWRKAEEAHRLILPATTPYTMTLFTTGPVRRDWGFWFGQEWRSHDECITHTPGGKSVFHYPKGV